jgi:phage-related protein
MAQRTISWLKGAERGFKAFPAAAQEELSFALVSVARGRHPDIARPLKGFGSGVFELALPYRGDAFRVVCAVQLAETIWVIHAFQKKSKTGIRTPQPEIEVIRERLKRLKEKLR